MSRLSLRENSYRRKHLSCVRHITLDPTGPGVVRIHMIPPHSQSPEDPYLLLLNGAQLVPLNFSWAVLLSEFMYCMEPYAGLEISADDWESMLEQTVRGVKKKVYPFVKAEVLRQDMGSFSALWWPLPGARSRRWRCPLCLWASTRIRCPPPTGWI